MYIVNGESDWWVKVMWRWFSWFGFGGAPFSFFLLWRIHLLSPRLFPPLPHLIHSLLRLSLHHRPNHIRNDFEMEKHNNFFHIYINRNPMSTVTLVARIHQMLGKTFLFFWELGTLHLDEQRIVFLISV